jgi:prevent-host-death family protein
MVNVLQIGNIGAELSNLVREVNDLQTQIVIESEGKPIVAMVRYDYLKNLIESLEDALDSAMLKKAVANNDRFFSFEDAIAAHNMTHNANVQIEDFTKV